MVHVIDSTRQPLPSGTVTFLFPTSRAAPLLGAAEAVKEGMGTSAVGIESLAGEYDRTLAWLHDRLSPEEYDTCWAEGCAMSLDDAAAYAVG